MNNVATQWKALAERYPEYVKNPHSWAAMVERYRDDVGRWKGSPQMLELVEYFAQQEYAASFSAGTSLMQLCISVEAYTQRLIDSLVIDWNNRLKVFTLDYYEVGCRNKPDRRTCKMPEAKNMVELKLLRMKLSYVTSSIG